MIRNTYLKDTAQYFTKRGMVVARPEYRIHDLDGSLPHESAEDGISAMRWFKARAGRGPG